MTSNKRTISKCTTSSNTLATRLRRVGGHRGYGCGRKVIYVQNLEIRITFGTNEYLIHF